MNRFEAKRKISIQKIWLLITNLFLIICILIFIFGIQNMKSNSSAEQIRHLRDVVTKDIAQCYALEGTYPPNLEYLEEHYGLRYDKKLFYIDYISIGSNIFPDISIISLE